MLHCNHYALLPISGSMCYFWHSADGPASVVCLSAINFQGWLIRQVSLWTLLSGFPLSGTPSCCLYQPAPFVVSVSIHLGTLAELLVHPTSPFLLTKIGPLETELLKLGAANRCQLRTKCAAAATNDISRIRSLTIGRGMYFPDASYH